MVDYTTTAKNFIQIQSSFINPSIYFSGEKSTFSTVRGLGGFALNSRRRQIPKILKFRVEPLKNCEKLGQTPNPNWKNADYSSRKWPQWKTITPSPHPSPHPPPPSIKFCSKRVKFLTQWGDPNPQPRAFWPYAQTTFLGGAFWTIRGGEGHFEQ